MRRLNCHDNFPETHAIQRAVKFGMYIIHSCKQRFSYCDFFIQKIPEKIFVVETSVVSYKLIFFSFADQWLFSVDTAFAHRFY